MKECPECGGMKLLELFGNYACLTSDCDWDDLPVLNDTCDNEFSAIGRAYRRFVSGGYNTEVVSGRTTSDDELNRSGNILYFITPYPGAQLDMWLEAPDLNRIVWIGSYP